MGGHDHSMSSMNFAGGMGPQYEFRQPNPVNTFKSNIFQGIVGDEQANVLPKRKTRKIDNFPFKVLDAP